MADKIISNLESVISVTGDMLLPVENGIGTFAASVDDIKNYTKENLNSATTTQKGESFLPLQITIANNVADANNDIDFSAGVFQFSDGSGQAVVTAMTKRLDASWVAGTGQGGLDTGAKANSTWYHCFAIYNPTTLVSDFLFSTNPTTPASLPTGYTKYKRVGSIRTNSSGNILAFYQSGKRFDWVSEVVEYNSTTPPTTLTTIGITAPLGIVTRAFLKCQLNVTTATSQSMSLKSLTSLAESSVNVQENDSDGLSFVSILTNSSSQIQHKCSTGSVQQYAFSTISWEDYQL